MSFKLKLKLSRTGEVISPEYTATCCEDILSIAVIVLSFMSSTKSDVKLTNVLSLDTARLVSSLILSRSVFVISITTEFSGRTEKLPPVRV